MSSGKANINYSMQSFDITKANYLSNLPVFETKDLIHLKQQEINLRSQEIQQNKDIAEQKLDLDVEKLNFRTPLMELSHIKP